MKALGKRPLPKGTLQAVGYLALAFVLSGWAADLSRKAADGALTPPLDDTFIYLQYARSAASGAPLEYQPGAAPTRGATSLLYPLLLAPWASGGDPDRLVWVAWAYGVLFLAGCALAADRWAARALGPPDGWVAGGLVLLNGHFVWGTASGMDIGLYAFSLTAVATAAAWYLDAPTARSGLRRLTVLGGLLLLLGLARPEGILIGGLVAVGLPLAGRAPNSRRARWAAILPPLAAAAVTVAVTLLALGHLGSNTLEAKAIWSEQRPDVRAAVLARLPWVAGRISLALFSDFTSTAYGFGTRHLLRGLLMGGAALSLVSAFRRRNHATSVRFVLAMVAAGLLTGLIPAGFNAHYNRYQIPYVPLALLLALHGWGRLLANRRRLRWAPILLLAVLSLPGLVRQVRLFGLNAGNIHDHQVAMGHWIDGHLPPDAVVGLNDAGAISYYGNRRVVDLVGLVTNGSALPNRAGPGSIFEWLEALPPRERPTHFAIFPSWYPYLRHTSLIGRKLVQFTLGRNTISGSDVEALYEANWSHTGGNRLILRAPLVESWGFAVVDSLDVADLASERAHAYRAWPTWRSSLREFAVQGIPRRLLIEGGRQPFRGERFRMRCRKGEPAVLVLRTEAFRPFRLEVRVDGRRLGQWSMETEPVTWIEPMFQIPGDALTGDTATIELTQPDSLPPYASFHYWLLQ